MKNKKIQNDNFILTKENINDLNKELKHLIHFKQKEIIEEIRQARAQGDLSENSRYDAAKQKQVEIEERIAKINDLLKHSEIAVTRKENVVLIGKKVKLLDLKSDQEMEFKIGTIFDICIKKNVISNASPLAKAIMGRKAGDKILVKSKDIVISYWVKILSIE